jgi:hypothetical protein
LSWLYAGSNGVLPKPRVGESAGLGLGAKPETTVQGLEEE